MAKPEIQTGVLAESEYPAWNALVGAASTGSVYARPEYLDALCVATGGRYRILAVKRGDLLLGGVGLYELDSAFGAFVSPRLLLYYNGPVLRQHESKYPSERTARDLKTLIALESALRQRGHGSMLLKPRSTLVDLRPFLARGWTASHGYSYVVPISDLEQARARVEQNLRRLIDRCGRAEMAFTEDDDFDSFCRLHELTMERVDSRVYLPVRAFRTFYETLARQGLARLFHARLPDGRAIASQLVLLGHSVTHTVSAGADPEHLKSGVTAFLRWKVFERLSALGFSANDLTDASLNAVTHFKSQLGGDLEPVVELRMPETARFRWGARLTRLAVRSRRCRHAAPRVAPRHEDSGMTSGIVALCDALQAVGIDCVFGVPGTQNVHLFEGFRQRRIRTVLASSELAASFMANGYYRATGRMAALATIPGPGFTYALTGIAEARLDSVGLVYLVGKPASEPGRRFHLQAIDQRAIASPLLKGCFTLDAAGDVGQVVRDAHAMAIGGEPGPVMIELDMGALSREQPLSRMPMPVRPAARDQPVAATLSRLQALFARAERPVLLLGQGAFGAATRLAALADSLTIPVVTTPTARGILSEAHPMAMGFDSLRGHTTTVNALFERSDLILGLGCKLGHNGSAGFDLQLPADRFVHVDAEPGVAGATYDAALAITARVEDVMPALESRRTVSGWQREELEAVGRALRAPTDQGVEPLVRGANAMKPAAFFAWLRDELPADTIVVTDSGLHQILTRRHFEVRSTRGLIVPSDFQSMGFGLPAAIGAKLAAPDRPVIAVVGDGGFLMSGMELLTARREGAALVVVVFNDGQLNQIRLQQWAAFGHAHAVRLLNPDYRALAAAFDVAYLRFGEHGPGEFARALGESKPVLVEVIVGDSLAMRALPPVVLAKELARATLGSALRRWLKARLRQAPV